MLLVIMHDFVFFICIYQKNVCTFAPAWAQATNKQIEKLWQI